MSDSTIDFPANASTFALTADGGRPHPLRKILGGLLGNAKKLLHDVVADPLGVDPNKSGPAGLINPSGIIRGAIVGLLAMLGSWGGWALVWGWTHLGVVLLPPPAYLVLTAVFGMILKIWHLFGHGPALVPTPARI